MQLSMSFTLGEIMVEWTGVDQTLKQRVQKTILPLVYQWKNKFLGSIHFLVKVVIKFLIRYSLESNLRSL
jgi:hypothetical protein